MLQIQLIGYLYETYDFSLTNAQYFAKCQMPLKRISPTAFVCSIKDIACWYTDMNRNMTNYKSQIA